MKKFISLFIICVSAVAFGQDANFSLVPRVMNVTENSFTVLFNTKSDALCWVEVAPDDGTTWYQKEYPKFYQDVSGRHYFGKKHSITVTGLKAGKSYRYRVLGTEIVKALPYKIEYGKNITWSPKWGKDNNKWSRTCSVKTLDSSAKECRFSVVNDIHFNDELMRSLVSGMPEGNDFLMLNGDIVSYSQNIDSVVCHTFNPIKEAASSMPVFYARGNHESRGNDWYLLPDEFPTNTGKFYYAFRQGPAAFIVLDAGEDKPDSDVEYYGTAAFDKYRTAELEWLKEAVKSKEFKKAPQKICIMHIPTMKYDGAWYSQNWIAENFAPVLAKAGIKLMIGAHHHQYILVNPGERGCKYTVFINSNKERLDVSINSKSIHLETHAEDGALVHSLDL